MLRRAACASAGAARAGPRSKRTKAALDRMSARSTHGQLSFGRTSQTRTCSHCAKLAYRDARDIRGTTRHSQQGDPAPVARYLFEGRPYVFAPKIGYYAALRPRGQSRNERSRSNQLRHRHSLADLFSWVETRSLVGELRLPRRHRRPRRTMCDHFAVAQENAIGNLLRRVSRNALQALDHLEAIQSMPELPPCSAGTRRSPTRPTYRFAPRKGEKSDCRSFAQPTGQLRSPS